MNKRNRNLEHQTWAIAHRGDSADFPENTRIAFQSALKAGVQAIELDVRLSYDGVPLICHDATLARYGGTQQSFRSMTASAITTVDVGRWKSPAFTGETVMTLAQALTLCRKVMLCVELKATAGRGAAAYHRRLVQAVIAVVEQARAQQRVQLLCFHPGVLLLCTRYAPNIARVRNAERLPQNVNAWLDRQTACVAVCFDQRLVTVNLVAAARDRGLSVYAYSANDKTSANHLLRCGVDGILSDRPGWLVSHLRDSQNNRKNQGI